MKKTLLILLFLLIGLTSFGQSITWTPVWTGFATDSRGISFIHVKDYQVAWAVAYDGADTNNTIRALTKTSDGANTWTAIDPLTSNGVFDQGVSMVFGMSGDEAYAALFKNNIGANKLIKTTDGGATWADAMPSSMYNSSNAFLNIVYFFDSQHGLLQGDPVGGKFEVYTTSDGGATWTPVSANDIPNPQANEFGYVHGYAVAGNSFWFTTATGRLYKTTDMGHTWTAYSTPIPDFGGVNVSGVYANVTFKDDNEGWILKNDKTLYHTTDGGATWTQVTTSGTLFPVDIAYLEGTTNTLLTAGSGQNDSGTSISTDGGATWTVIDNNVQHLTISPKDMHYVLSGGFSNQANSEGVFVYKDATSVKDNAIKNLLVYPNPANNYVKVSIPNNHIKEIVLFDVTGKEVAHYNNLDISNYTLDLSHFNKGFYLLKVTDEHQANQTIKLVVK